MTSQAPARLLGSETLHAVASTAIRPLLTGTVAEGRLLGASSQAAWIAVADEVLVLGTADAVRLPNGVVLAGSEPGPLGRAAPGDPAAVGHRFVVLSGVRAGVVRWWDPRPVLARCLPEEVRDRLSRVRRRTALMSDSGLGAALVSGDGDTMRTVTFRLIGRGPGLTPEGDDLLAAGVAAYRLIGDALGYTAAPRRVDALRVDLDAVAADRTTALAASLLRHACDGNVAEPVAHVLHALAGRGELVPAVHELLKVGHSSGAALLAGVVAGAEAACAGVAA